MSHDALGGILDSMRCSISAEVEEVCCGGWHNVYNFGLTACCVCQHAENHDEYFLFLSKAQLVKQLHSTGVLKQP